MNNPLVLFSNLSRIIPRKKNSAASKEAKTLLRSARRQEQFRSQHSANQETASETANRVSAKRRQQANMLTIAAPGPRN